MGKRGPAPKSAELESKQGFPGRRKSRTKAVIDVVKKAKTDVQDSPNVPAKTTPSATPSPPSWLKGRRAQAIFTEIVSDPGRKLWFKPSDYRFIARHALKLAALERMMSRPPQPTYETVTAAKQRIVRPNPAYVKMMELDREVRAEEQLLAGNPLARLMLESKTTKDGTPPQIDRHGQPAPVPADKPAPAGPLGVLKAPPRPNSRPN